MKVFVTLAVLLSIGLTDLFAQDLPEYCVDDSQYQQQLRALGPVITVGASVSGGLWAKPFSTLVAEQMCLTEGDGYEARYSFMFFGAKLSFLKEMYIEQRPSVVIALDHLHHSTKSKKFDAVTRAYIDREFARIALDCSHAVVDCSEEGEFYFVPQENYRPIVLLGDVYASYAEDCSGSNPDNGGNRKDRDRNSIEKRERGCIDDYQQINQYMQQKADQIPNLYLFPVSRFFSHLHRGLPFLYAQDGKLGSFYTDDLFWDGFHPWSEPGSQIMANIVLLKLNELITSGVLPGTVAIPYIPIADKYYPPFTGIVLIDDTGTGISPDAYPRFVSPQGEAFRFNFAAQSSAFRRDNGDWGYPAAFSREGPITGRVGGNPLVLTLTRLTESGQILLSDRQLAQLKQVVNDPRNELLGGVITHVD